MVNKRLDSPHDLRTICQTGKQSHWHSVIEIATNLAHRAGERLVTLFEDGTKSVIADRVAHKILTDGLLATFADIPVISEEEESPKRMDQKDCWWLIDPLDGSKYFDLHDRGWSVMMALMYGGRPVFGLIHDPLTRQIMVGVVGLGAWKEQGATPLQVTRTKSGDRLRIVVKPMGGSRRWLSRIPPEFEPQSVHYLGSVGLRACAVACGEADLQIHSDPGLNTWDTAAPEAIVLAAGGFCTDMNGAPLQYDQPGQPHLKGALMGNALGYAGVPTVYRTLPPWRKIG